MKIPGKMGFSRATAIAVVFIAVLVLAAATLRFRQENSLMKNADRIIALCKDESYRPLCYDREIPKLMKALSMEDTFKAARIIEDKDPKYPYCHVLGHFLGGAETAKDPSKWKDVAARCPTDMCSNGCMHGVFQERFRKEALPDSSVDEVGALLAGICEPRQNWNATWLERGTCTHALGHLTMYVTNADAGKSLQICDKISINRDGHDLRPLCYDGVFMQLFQPLEPDDFSLVEGKVPLKSHVKKFCFSFSGEARNSCWSESWPESSDFLKESPANAASFCGELSDDKSRKQCARDIFYIVAVEFNLDEKKMADYCAKGSGGIKDECFALSALRLLEVDYRNTKQAVGFCRTAEKFGAGDACYRELSFNASHDFPSGSKEFIGLCKALPAELIGPCLSGR